MSEAKFKKKNSKISAIDKTEVWYSLHIRNHDSSALLLPRCQFVKHNKSTSHQLDNHTTKMNCNQAYRTIRITHRVITSHYSDTAHISATTRGVCTLHSK